MQDLNWRRWLRRLWQTLSHGRRSGKAAKRPSIGPRLEPLEDRLTPTTPAVSSISASNPTSLYTNATSVTYAVNFNQSVTGVDATDFQVATSGTVQVSTPVSVSGSGSSYTVIVSGIHGDGALQLNLVDDDSIQGSGLALGGSGTGNGSFQGPAYNILPTLPSVSSINRTNPAGPNTSASTATYTVTFNTSVTGVDIFDFQVVAGGTVGYSFAQVSGSGTTYSVTINGITGNGTLGLNLVDDGSIHDLAGNPLMQSTAPSSAFFQSASTFATGTRPVSIATGDLNADGKADLVVANDTSIGTASVALGNGNGTFQAPQAISAGAYPTSVVIADINGDGKPDILFANNAATGSVSILLGNGNGTFQTRKTIGTTANPTALAVADVNGDGKADLATVSFNSTGTLSVLLGNGDSTFQTNKTVGAGSYPSSLAIADVSGDGKPDVVVSNYKSAFTNLLLGNGNGTFQSSNKTFATDKYPISVAMGDVSGDGKADIVTENAPYPGSVSVLLGNSNGTFQGQQTFGVGRGPFDLQNNASFPLALGDLNGDGKNDLALVNYGSNNVSTLLGNGNGTFQTQQTFSTGTDPSSLTVGDFNGDGRLDLAVVNLNSNTAAVYLNTMTGNFTGQSYTVTAAAAPASRLVVSGFTAPTTAGAAHAVTVTAKDSSGNTVTNFTGTVTLSSSDPLAAFDNTTYTFLAADNGVHAFNSTLKTAGTQSITAIDFGDGFIASQSSITVAASSLASLSVSGFASSTTAGAAHPVAVAAKDAFGNAVTGYTGTVVLSSSDGAANFDTTTYAFLAADNGVHSFSTTLKTAGTRSITATDSVHALTSSQTGIVVSANTATSLAATGFAAPTTAGVAHNFQVTARDAFNNVAVNFAGVVSLVSSDGAGSFDTTTYTFTIGPGNDNGVHTFSAILKTAGTQSITASTAGAGSVGQTGIVVNPAAAASLQLSGYPSPTITGVAHNLTVTALDAFGNTARGYTGTVRLTSTDAASVLGATSYTFVGSDNGVHFFSATFNTPAAAQTLNVVDTNNAVIPGFTTVQAIGLTVTQFTPTASGFVATFNKAFDPAQISLITSGASNLGAADVTVSTDGNPIAGSLLINSTNTGVTFVQTGTILAPGTYVVAFRSSSNGFVDLSGGPLAGNSGLTPNTDAAQTFTVADSTATLPTLSIPDFARGPDSSSTIKAPTNAGTGIPVTLSNASAVTDATFRLSYDPTLLNISGVSGTGFTLVSNTGGVASFHYANATPQSDSVVLGQILAQVPSSATSKYKAKELLQLGSIVVNGSGTGILADAAVHVNAYLGDATGDGKITGADINLVSRIPGGLDTGFGAYQTLDPALLADVTGDGLVNATDVGQLNRFVANLTTTLIPTPPGFSITATGPDPELSIPANLQMGADGVVRVPVNIDDPRPAGSTGLTSATLALTYDPTQFSVSSADIALGSVTGAAKGWRLTSHIDSATGQIAIELYSPVPINSATAGSLVTIDFHSLTDVPGASINLVNSVSPGGRTTFQTTLSDNQGLLTLHPFTVLASVIEIAVPSSATRAPQAQSGPEIEALPATSVQTIEVGAPDSEKASAVATERLAAAFGEGVIVEEPTGAAARAPAPLPLVPEASAVIGQVTDVRSVVPLPAAAKTLSSSAEIDEPTNDELIEGMFELP